LKDLKIKLREDFVNYEKENFEDRFAEGEFAGEHIEFV